MRRPRGLWPAWRRRPPRHLLALGLAGALLVAGLAYGGVLWRYWSRHVSTDDAYIAGRIAPVSARIPGTVGAVLVTDNQDVKAGDALVRLDARDYEVAVAQARAAAQAAKAELENALVNVPMADETTRSLVQQAVAALAGIRDASQMATHDLDQRRGDLMAKDAAVQAAQAALRATEADLERARLDRDRAAGLVRTQLIAQQDYDHAEATFKMAQAAHDAAGQKLEQARADTMQAQAAVRSQGAALAQSRQRVGESVASLANAESQRMQVKVKQAQLDAARAHLTQALATLQQAELNLDYTTLRAPLGGRVTKKAVEVGQVVQPGQSLLSVVDLDDVWVVANYKETQLTHVRPGQRATVTVDAYPDVVFKARVDSIQAGSGAVFSLLPPENASGNFVKVVQRVPVKLVFERGETARHLLVPGVSVVPTIEIR